MKPGKKRAWLSWTIWLVVILILAKFMNGEKVVGATVEADGLSFKTDSGYASQLKWDEIQNLELRESFSCGTLIEGMNSDKEKSGIWSNSEFGVYELFFNVRLNRCIVCQRVSGQVIVFNFESDESTKSLYDAILKRIG